MHARLGHMNQGKYTSSGTGRYRWGFQGQEKDDAVKGAGNSYDFGARMYDSRLGRWKIMDQMFKLQPDQSTYKSFMNNPLIYSDEDGNIEVELITIIDKRTGAEVTFGKILSNDIFPAENRNDGGLAGALLTKVRVWRDRIHQTTVTINEDGSFSVDKTTKFGEERLTTRGIFRESSLYANAINDNLIALKSLANLTLNFEGPGESQAGGLVLKTDGYTVSPTKTQAENLDIDEIDADNLIAALGGLSGGGVHNTSNKVIRLLNNYSNFDSFINSLNEAVETIMDQNLDNNSNGDVVQKGDTVRCRYCLENNDSTGFVIQGDGSREHVTPVNEDVPDEQEDD